MPLPLSRTAARSLYKLMMVKDEYEVARLYTDGRFQAQLAEQFEPADGQPMRLAFHMAPPLLARARDGAPPRKLRLGAWMLPLGVLAAPLFEEFIFRGLVFRGLRRSMRLLPAAVASAAAPPAAPPTAAPTKAPVSPPSCLPIMVPATPPTPPPSMVLTVSDACA